MPWSLITYLGDPRFWIGISIIFFIIRIGFKISGKKKFLWSRNFIIFVGVSMGLAFLLTTGLKEIFKIPRECIPCPGLDCNPFCSDSFSFPSGHATAAFAAFTGLFLILRKKKYLWIFIIPSLVAFSRVALGVHTYLDIFVGSIIGLLFSLGFYFIIRKVFKFGMNK